MRLSTGSRSFQLVLAAASALAVWPAAASAGTITVQATTLSYAAAPGEDNVVSVSENPYAVTCGDLGTPCLEIGDAVPAIAFPSDDCRRQGPGGSDVDIVLCRLPSALSVSLGDGSDAIFDWDGPSLIDMGPGDDSLAHGNGGDDVITGGEGDDILDGHGGNDTLDGGPGDDALEGLPQGAGDISSTAGSDTYIGGGGQDSLTYEAREEPLAISLDGERNDGAPGENDAVAPDIRTIAGGMAGDVISGGAGPDVMLGLGGDDRLLGLAGDDRLVGGAGHDELLGDAGQDVLGGEDGDDVLDGGAGVDRFWGDDIDECKGDSCVGGKDRILARDAVAEEVNCGLGTDTAVVDALDVVADSPPASDRCETVDRPGEAGATGPAPGSPTARRGRPGVTFGGATLDRRGRFVLRLSSPWAGRARVTASVRVTRRGRRHTMALGRALLRAPRAWRTRLRLSPSRDVRSAIRRMRRITLVVRVSFRPAGGAAVTVSRHIVTVRRPSG